MLDKNLIQKKFEKSISTYNSNAIVQKHMAIKLINLIKGKNFKNILEIGSYTGILTKLAIEKFNFEKYFAIDIINSNEYIKNLSDKIIFKQTDIEKYCTQEKFDLIISNASLQWCSDFFGTIEKLKNFLNKDGILAITIFGKENLKEIKDVFNIGLLYPTIEEIKNKFGNNIHIEEEIKTLDFKTEKNILEHLKYTGVNAISNKTLSITEIKNKLKLLNEIHNNNLTYHPIYIILKSI